MKKAASFQELHDQLILRGTPFFVVFFLVMCISYGFFFAVDFIPEPPADEERIENAFQDVPVINKTINKINGGLLPKIKETVAPHSLRVVIPESDPTTSVTDEPAAIVVPEPTVEVPPASAVEVAEPEPVKEVMPPAPVSSVNAVPLSITFDALDRTVVVKNPTSRTVASLDAALLGGVVRHPDSADFEHTGNIFILGHSSYLPNVFNKNFQAFNGIQKLAWGDTIRLASSDTEYVYRVDRVYEAKASDVVVPNSRGVAKLTLATCNSFATKDDRFMVEATLMSTKTL